MSNEKLVLHGYIWFKLCQFFIMLWQESLGFSVFLRFEFIELLSSLPLYIMFLCYLFEFKLKFKLVWIALFVIAVSHELLLSLERYVGVMTFTSDDFYFEFLILAILAPLYLVAYNYLFRSKGIWNNA